MATTALGYEAAAFTTTQWKELERQAMIYKYMVASVPVPPYLLLPPDSSSDKDPEIGRCKRTDGKKWRCSRDVAPHQKYCERHMHRGRPRSRKPVELTPTNKKTRLHLSPATVSTAAPQPQPPSPRLLGSPISGNQLDNSSSILLNNTSDTSLSLYNRGLELMMSKDTCEQQLEKYMNGGFMYTSTINPSIFEQNHGEEEQLNLLSLPDIGNSYNDEFNLFLNPYDQPPRDFIDAWSNDNNPNSKINDTNYSSSANGNLSPSLNLSMATTVGDSLDDELGEIQMGETRDVTNQRCQRLSWLSPVSWIDSEPGGPLAEVLRPSNVNINSDQGCGYTGKNGDGDAISPPATSATSASSSPSGVLHRTMLSLSDTSVCNSPTLAAATSSAAPEIVGFQCLG